MDKRRRMQSGLRAVAAALVGVALAGCSMPLADLPSPFGLPAGAPPRPETQAAFPAVHDMPAPRQETLLEPDEQQRLQRDLEQARDQQAAKAGVPRRSNVNASKAGRADQQK